MREPLREGGDRTRGGPPRAERDRVGVWGAPGSVGGGQDLWGVEEGRPR